VYEGLPVTIKGVTIPADVVVIDTTAYSLIVGNEWLTKAKAKIDWETMTVGLHWAGNRVTIPVQCWKPNDIIEVKDNRDSEESEDSEGSDTDDEDDDDEADLCTVALTSDEVHILRRAYPRAYLDYLEIRERQVRHPKVVETYGSQGPDR
jgi:hypothetical protein